MIRIRREGRRLHASFPSVVSARRPPLWPSPTARCFTSLPSPTSASSLTLLMEQLRKVDTTVLCDADKAIHGMPNRLNDAAGAASAGSKQSNREAQEEVETSARKERIALVATHVLQPLPSNSITSTSTMVGIARTVLLSRSDDILGVFEGLLEGQPNEVLVVSTTTNGSHGNACIRKTVESAPRFALAGDLFCTEAVRRGMTGMVIAGGGMRDTAQIARQLNASNFRAYASFITPYAGTAKHVAENMQCDVTITDETSADAAAASSVTVRPKDLLVGDDDGLLVGSIGAFQAILPLALEIQSLEGRIRQGLQDGRSLETMTNVLEHLERCRTRKRDDEELESSLEFSP